MKYPILLVHGMGFRDRRHFCYWGRIPQALEKEGCKVFFGGQDANGSVEDNAAHLCRRIDEILAETGAEKVNVFAHSKGGLDMRYAISKLGADGKIASLSTFQTPHNGSRTIDLVLHVFPKWLLRAGSALFDLWMRLWGDKKPRTYACIECFSTAAARRFNKENRDVDGIYYQSCGFVMKKWYSDIFLWWQNLIVGAVEGENDGLLPPEAVRWTNFRGVYHSNSARGISHCDEVDMRRRPLTKKTGGGISDIPAFYADIARELAKMGF